MSKEVEMKGYDALAYYIEKEFPHADLTPTMNKGRGSSEGIADAILEIDGVKHYVEIKASSKTIGTNIRFTHQTMAKALGHEVIIALISNLANGPGDIAFFRLSDVAEAITVEPHFIVPHASAKAIKSGLHSLLAEPAGKLDLSKQLCSTVAQHMNVGGKP